MTTAMQKHRSCRERTQGTQRNGPSLRSLRSLAAILSVALAATVSWAAGDFQRLPYNNPGLTVDLAVGLWAWPIPVDFDGDGDLDLVVACPDTPHNGTYFFENVAGRVKFPIFKPARRIGKGTSNVMPSYDGKRVRVLGPAQEYPDFLRTGLDQPVKLPLPPNLHPQKVRANQWRYADFDGDGRTDLVVGVGDWTEYGWDNAFDASGRWTRGPLHARVYIVRNTGDNAQPVYAPPVALEADGQVLDNFGMPSPNFADFDGDGDLDLLCGEFLDGFTYYENTGTRTAPRYAAGRRLKAPDGQPLAMDLEMIVPVAIDWDGDGDLDLVVGQEDGRVALVENTGARAADGTPQFLPPRFFQQEADEVKFGALVTPVAFDWDGDGDEDLLCGNSAGYIGFIENLGGDPPRWAAPRCLEADGKVFRIMAGPNGSVQGPCEAKWGYTTLSAADWDGDGLPDLVVNSIWGKVVWLRNTGTRTQPKLAAPQPIEVEWAGAPPKPDWVWWTPAPRELVTQWRTTPVAVDWNRDGLTDLVMLDAEGYLAFFERQRRDGRLVLLPPRRVFRGEHGSVFDSNGGIKDPGDGLLQLNNGKAGGSGRRKFCLADWDGDGRPDLLVNSLNVSFLKNLAERDGAWTFRDMGRVADLRLAGHDTSPTVVHWGGKGPPDLLVGAEDGSFYRLANPYAKRAPAAHGPPAAHLVAAWDFEEANGGPLADKAPAGAVRDTLTALGGAKVEHGMALVPGTKGAAFRADDSADLSPDAEMTLWARLRLEHPPKKLVSLIDKRRFTPESRAYGIFASVAGAAAVALGGQVSADGSAAHALSSMTGAEPIPTGHWCQVALVVRRAEHGLVAEWFARDDDPAADTGAWKRVGGPATGVGVNRIHRSDQPLLLGNDANLGATGVPVEFDEVRLYNRALGTEELSGIQPGNHGAKP